jgi:HPt (histidine-containing phosphotransfer) domain-containing protein
MKTSSSIIDPEVRKSLQELTGETGVSLWEELRELFMKDSPRMLGDLATEVEAQNWYVVGRIAHQFKSTCGNIGAFELMDVFSTIEDRAHATVAPTIEEGRRWMEDLETRFENLFLELRQG